LIQISIDEINSGQVLARTVWGDNGEVLLTAGYKLNEDVVEKLRKNRLDFLWVQEEGLEDIVPEEMVSEVTRLELVKALQQMTESFRARLAKEIPENKPDHFLKAPEEAKDFLDLQGVKRHLRTLVRELGHTNSPLLYLNSIPGSPLGQYENIVDTIITSVVLAKRYNYNDTEIDDLATGAMLKEIGFSLIPKELVEKGNRITFAEFCLLKEHPEFGYKILKENPLIPLVVAHVALQHHERQDGGGYPRRLHGTNTPPLKRDIVDKNHINRYAEVVSVAQRYVEYLYPHDANQAKTPMETVKFLLKASGTELNSHIVDTLIPMIPLYSLGTRVLITRDPDPDMIGCSGVVSALNPDQQDRPEVILLYDKQGQRMEHFKLQLKDFPDTTIREVLPGDTEV